MKKNTNIKKIKFDPNCKPSLMTNIIGFFQEINRMLEVEPKKFYPHIFRVEYEISWKKYFEKFDVSDIPNTDKPTREHYLWRIADELQFYFREKVDLENFFNRSKKTTTTKNSNSANNIMQSTEQEPTLEETIEISSNVIKGLKVIFSEFAIGYFKQVDMLKNSGIVFCSLINAISTSYDYLFEMFARGVIVVHDPLNLEFFKNNYDEAMRFIEFLVTSEKFLTAYNNINNYFGGNFSKKTTKKELIKIINGLKGNIYTLTVGINL
jgi:hypothetical protein